MKKEKKVRPKQTLKDIKEKWRIMLEEGFSITKLTNRGTEKWTNKYHPLFCVHEHCKYWRDNSFLAKKTWKKDLKEIEKKMEKFREKSEDE